MDAPTLAEKCLQININSLADARACVRHLQHIHDSYIVHGCSAIDLWVAKGLENEGTVKDLSMNFRWCKTYRTLVSPGEGNVLCQVPHFEERAWQLLEAERVNAKPAAATNVPRGTIERRRGRRPGRPKLAVSEPTPELVA